MKSLERKNEDLRDEITTRDETIEQLQSNIKQMQVEHSRVIMNKDNEQRKALEAREAEHKEEISTLNSITNKAYRWLPHFADLLRIERICKQIGLSATEFATIFTGKVLNFTGRLFSTGHKRWVGSKCDEDSTEKVKSQIPTLLPRRQEQPRTCPCAR